MNRALLAPAALVLIALPTVAETPISTETVYACASESDDARRLACYDDAVGRLKAAEDAGDVATVTRAEVEQVEKESFGFSIPSLPKLALPKLGGSNEGGLDQIEQAVTSVRLNGYKKAVITLENGQVWQQTDTAKIFISKKRPPEMATIKTASMGSFLVKLDGGRAFRAERIK